MNSTPDEEKGDPVDWAHYIEVERERNALQSRASHLEAAIRQLRDAKGRFNTMIAYKNLVDELERGQD